MLTSVALLVSQVSVVDWPLSIVLGLAVSDAVGAAGGGGGGGGGGATFFLEAASILVGPQGEINIIPLNFGFFTFFFLPLKEFGGGAGEFSSLLVCPVMRANSLL